MGLRAVTLGHAYEPVVEAAARQMRSASTSRALRRSSSSAPRRSSRPDSRRRDGQVRQERLGRHDGRREARPRRTPGGTSSPICQDHPFFSTDDWFIGSTAMPAGNPGGRAASDASASGTTISTSVEALFREHPGQIACVILEAETIEPPRDRLPSPPAGPLPRARRDLHPRRDDHGFSLAPRGRAGLPRHRSRSLDVRQGDRQRILGLRARREARADGARLAAARRATGCSCFRRPMERRRMPGGGRSRRCESTERRAWSRSSGVKESGCSAASRRSPGSSALEGHFALSEGRATSSTRPVTAEGRPSQAFRTLFLQELIRRGDPGAVVRRELFPHRRGHRSDRRGRPRSPDGLPPRARGRRREVPLKGPAVRPVFPGIPSSGAR